MPLYCGGLDSIPELSKSWYATPAHRYRNCQCALISNGYRISAECRNTPSCPALFQHLGRNITLPQIIQSRVNPYRFTIENGHDAPPIGVSATMSISPKIMLTSMPNPLVICDTNASETSLDTYCIRTNRWPSDNLIKGEPWFSFHIWR